MRLTTLFAIYLLSSSAVYAQQTSDNVSGSLPSSSITVTALPDASPDITEHELITPQPVAEPADSPVEETQNTQPTPQTTSDAELLTLIHNQQNTIAELSHKIDALDKRVNELENNR